MRGRGERDSLQGWKPFQTIPESFGILVEIDHILLLLENILIILPAYPGRKLIGEMRGKTRVFRRASWTHAPLAIWNVLFIPPHFMNEPFMVLIILPLGVFNFFRFVPVDVTGRRFLKTSIIPNYLFYIMPVCITIGNGPKNSNVERIGGEKDAV
jgi:hypothetical protein